MEGGREEEGGEGKDGTLHSKKPHRTPSVTYHRITIHVFTCVLCERLSTSPESLLSCSSWRIPIIYLSPQVRHLALQVRYMNGRGERERVENG